jgi:hypothetical protein
MDRVWLNIRLILFGISADWYQIAMAMIDHSRGKKILLSVPVFQAPQTSKAQA